MRRPAVTFELCGPYWTSWSFGVHLPDELLILRIDLGPFVLVWQRT